MCVCAHMCTYECVVVYISVGSRPERDTGFIEAGLQTFAIILVLVSRLQGSNRACTNLNAEHFLLFSLLSSLFF